MTRRKSTAPLKQVPKEFRQFVELLIGKEATAVLKSADDRAVMKEIARAIRELGWKEIKTHKDFDADEKTCWHASADGVGGTRTGRRALSNQAASEIEAMSMLGVGLWGKSDWTQCCQGEAVSQ